MDTTWEARRQRAIERLLDGEAFTVVCRSKGVSRSWLYKWWARHAREAATWFHDDSRRTHTQPGRTAAEIEEIVQGSDWSCTTRRSSAGPKRSAGAWRIWRSGRSRRCERSGASWRGTS